MKYYSGEGDQGETRIFGNQRFSKSNLFFDLIGSLDEATAHLGMGRSLCKDKGLASDLLKIQDQISTLMGLLSKTDSIETQSYLVLYEYSRWLEAKIDAYDELIQKPKAFIYAGESNLGSAIDIARTVIRRVERIAVKYFFNNNVGKDETLTYLNRLSSFVFVLRIYADSFKG